MTAVARRVVTAWVASEATQSLDEWAKAAGMSRSAYVRQLIENGGPPVANINVQAVRELRRIGVMLRNFLRTPPARWTPAQTEQFFAALALIDDVAKGVSQGDAPGL